MTEARQNPFPGLRPFKFHEHELFFGREEQYEQMIDRLSETRFLAVVGTSGSGKSSLVRAGLLPALYGGLMMSAGPRWRIAVFRPKDDPIRELALALNHRRVFGDRSEENGASLFKLTESIDWPRLCSRLGREAARDGRSPGGRILEVLPLAKRQIITEAAGNGDIEDKSEVVQTFNEILKQRDLYQVSDFKRVLVPGEAGDLLTRGQNNLTSSEIEKLNRLLLEASYPQEIAKKVEIHTQISEVILRRGDLGLVEAARQAQMSPEENLLVVVDQFEELFRYARVSENSPHGNQAAAFVKLLLQAKSQTQIPIYVVLTMRSDYLGDCAKFWDLPEAINEGQYLIPRLTRDQRREAINGPVRLRGATITPQLVNQLLTDMGDDPDQLPILQHALMRTWDYWEKDHAENEPLDLRHYVAIGRMTEALSRHADEAYAELPDDRSRSIVEQIFKCLTERGTGERETRRPTDVKDIRAVTNAKLKEIVAVINVFRQEGRSFLMPSPKKPLKRTTSIDISHESLIRNWTKLRKWVDAEAQSANVYRRLVETSRLHEQGLAGLLSDLEVEHALRWKERNKPNLAWATRYHADLDLTQKSTTDAILEEAARKSDQEIFGAAMAFLEKSRRARKTKAQIRSLSKILIAASVVLVFVFFWGARQWMSSIRENRLKARLAYGAEMNLAQREFELANLAEVNRLLEGPNTSQQQLGFLNRFEWYRWLIAPNDILKQDVSLRGFEWYHLWLLSHDESRTLGEYGSGILSVASPNNSTILTTATDSGTIELRDLNRGNILATLEGNSKDTSTVAFAPDGRNVAIGRRDGSIGLWELSNDSSRTTFRRELTIPQSGGLPPVHSIAFSPDSRFFAVGTHDGAVRVWITNEVKELPRLRTDARGPVLAVAFSSDGQRLAIAQKGIVTLIDVTNWQPDLKVDSANAMLIDPNTVVDPPPINCLAFSPDRKILAIGTSNNTVLLWDLIENKYLVALLGHSMEVRTVAFSNETLLASGSRDGGIRLWDVNKFSNPEYRNKVLEKNALIEQKYNELMRQKLRAVSRANLSRAHLHPQAAGNLADMRRQSESEISQELLSGTRNGHAGAVTSVAFLPNQQTFVSGSDDRTVKLWAVNPKSTKAVKLGQPSTTGVSSLSFSPNGEILAGGNYNGYAVLWNTREKPSLADPGEKILEQAQGPISSVAFSPDGGILAIGSWDKTVTLWQVSTKKKLLSLAEHTGPVLTIAFSPDGSTLATGSADKTVRLWDVKTGKGSIVTKRDETEAVLALAFAPKGRRILAIGTTENTIVLWDLDRGKEVRNWQGHADDIGSIVFSPDATTLATGSSDTTAKLWDPKTGKELATLHGHSKRVLSLSFSPDGKRLASSSEDGSVKLWDTGYEPGEKSTRHALVTLKDVQSGPAFAVAFSPDGNTLATGNGDGTVLIRYAVTKESIARQSPPRN